MSEIRLKCDVFGGCDFSVEHIYYREKNKFIAYRCKKHIIHDSSYKRISLEEAVIIEVMIS
jgi:hypothetical protein